MPAMVAYSCLLQRFGLSSGQHCGACCISFARSTNSNNCAVCTMDAHAKQEPYPTHMDLLGISRYSLANMAVSDKRPLALLMSATCHMRTFCFLCSLPILLNPTNLLTFDHIKLQRNIPRHYT